MYGIAHARINRLTVCNLFCCVADVQLLKISGRELSEYIKAFCFTVQTLQHLCRQAIRHSMRSNVLYAAKTLPIPATMQNYICFR